MEGTAIKKVNDEAIRLLRIWGDHRAGRTFGLRCLGFPSQTVESRHLMAPGRSDGQLRRSPDYYPSKTAIWVEKRLTDLESRLKNFLWVEYVLECSGKTHIEREQKKMNAMGVTSIVNFKSGMEVAHEKACKLLNVRYYIYT